MVDDPLLINDWHPVGTIQQMAEGKLLAVRLLGEDLVTAYLLKESAGPSFSIFLTITPHDIVDSSVWMWMGMNYGHDLPAEELIAWQDEIFAQDRPIVESQRPELLPLDLQKELHLRSDRTAIAYRQWLQELGLTFGTA